MSAPEFADNLLSVLNQRRIDLSDKIAKGLGAEDYPAYREQVGRYKQLTEMIYDLQKTKSEFLAKR